METRLREEVKPRTLGKGVCSSRAPGTTDGRCQGRKSVKEPTTHQIMQEKTPRRTLFGDNGERGKSGTRSTLRLSTSMSSSNWR